ncbi:MAG: fcl [Nitrospira sp.]|nr:fcl [Nitrospira sp.]
MDKRARIYVAGHRGMVGSAIVRALTARGYDNLILRTSRELDLRDNTSVATLFAETKPEYVFLAAAKVGGILANSTFPAEFIYDNLAIQTNVIHQAYVHGVISPSVRVRLHCSDADESLRSGRQLSSEKLTCHSSTDP